jgi:hypothetical protein
MSIDIAESPSSRDALTHGLFAVRYFIRQGEEEEYAETLTSLIAELAPQGIIEETFAAEIVGATWRLRRCRMVEQSLSPKATLDPMVDDALEKQQKSVDRARAQSHNILRRSIAELRKLQTDRVAREQAAESRRQTELELMQSLTEEMAEDNEAEDPVEDNEAEERDEDAEHESDQPAPPSEIPFCKSTQLTPRGAPCPCGSGLKYKRCCGQGAPPVLNEAA